MQALCINHILKLDFHNLFKYDELAKSLILLARCPSQQNFYEAVKYTNCRILNEINHTQKYIWLVDTRR